MSNRLNKEIGQRIAQAIEEINMSQSELARRLGRAPSRITDLIYGRTEIRIHTLRQIARITGKPIAWFLGIELSPEDVMLHRYHELPPDKQAEVRRYIEFQIERLSKE